MRDPLTSPEHRPARRAGPGSRPGPADTSGLRAGSQHAKNHRSWHGTSTRAISDQGTKPVWCYSLFGAEAQRGERRVWRHQALWAKGRLSPSARPGSMPSRDPANRPAPLPAQTPPSSPRVQRWHPAHRSEVGGEVRVVLRVRRRRADQGAGALPGRQARLDEFQRAGTLRVTGPFGNPQEEGSMSIMTTRDAAEEFAAASRSCSAASFATGTSASGTRRPSHDGRSPPVALTPTSLGVPAPRNPPGSAASTAASAEVDVDHAAMQGALQRPVVPVGIDLALAQIAAPVGAFVVHRVERAVHVHQGQEPVSGGDDPGRARWHVLDLRHLDVLSHSYLP